MSEMHGFWEINLGNVLTMVGGIFALATIWWRTAQRDQSNKDLVASLQLRLIRSEGEIDQLSKMGVLTMVNQHERRLAEVERVIQSLIGMQTDIGWIKRELSSDRDHTN